MCKSGGQAPLTQNMAQLMAFMYTEKNIRTLYKRRPQYPRGLWRRSSAARLLGLWVRIPPGGMDVCCECCVLSGRDLCDGL